MSFAIPYIVEAIGIWAVQEKYGQVAQAKAQVKLKEASL
ncbi:hypothetical protein C7437_1011121 [Psychrobacillus insolitus]|uniref:Uncharacterized protein n=1 Tax=Psychrobacillus insolitus TaxID=1461 RepID=A0A2W7NC17_9BACI|nr:hypothetical protein C7437_1011121 [Psychrobacillus insolitus]